MRSTTLTSTGSKSLSFAALATSVKLSVVYPRELLSSEQKEKQGLGTSLKRSSFKYPQSSLFLRSDGFPYFRSVRHSRAVQSEIRRVSIMNEEELQVYAKEIQAPFHLLKETARLKRLPVVNFAAGGIATPGESLSNVLEVVGDRIV